MSLVKRELSEYKETLIDFRSYYSHDLLVGASPVQLRISEAEGKHNKETALRRYFCFHLQLTFFVVEFEYLRIAD